MPETGSVFEVSQSDNGLDIRLSSTMVHIDDICNLVTLFMKSREWDLSSHLFAVNLVIREGLTNAIRHGNKNDPAKMVRFWMEIDGNNTIRISIADQGKGFDRSQVASVPVPSGADHGRGMPIMETYFDRCRYNKAGNVLYLEKTILSHPGQDI